MPAARRALSRPAWSCCAGRLAGENGLDHWASAMPQTATPHDGSARPASANASMAGPNSNECSSDMPRANGGCTGAAQEFANLTVPYEPCWWNSCTCAAAIDAASTKTAHRMGSLPSGYSTTKNRACALPAVFSRSAALLYGRPFLTLSAQAALAPGTVIRSASEAVLAFIGMNVNCASLAVASGPTYLPISRSNCAHVFHGRYSANSRAIRRPAPGTSRISSDVAVLRLMCTNAFA